jgi:hypothetical protein
MTEYTFYIRSIVNGEGNDSKVIIELEFDDKPNDADVYNYLNELMDNDCLSYEIKETEND